MKITINTYAEHKSLGRQEIYPRRIMGSILLAPGASSSCVGCSSCSCAAIKSPEDAALLGGVE